MRASSPSATPTARAAARTRSSTASWASSVEASTKLEGRNQASTPSCSQNAPIARTLSDEARQTASARSSSSRSRSAGRFDQKVSTKPPLRPLGPCPQRSASSSTMRADGSRSSTCHAVHMPA